MRSRAATFTLYIVCAPVLVRVLVQGRDDRGARTPEGRRSGEPKGKKEEKKKSAGYMYASHCTTFSFEPTPTHAGAQSWEVGVTDRVRSRVVLTLTPSTLCSARTRVLACFCFLFLFLNRGDAIGGGEAQKRMGRK